MEIINILAKTEFSGWFSQNGGICGAITLIKNILELLRIVVPIGLIVMTTLDVAKKVINPNEKDGQKKIMTRVFKLIDIGKNSGNSYKESQSSLSACWGGNYGG